MTVQEIEKLQKQTEQYGATHLNQVQQNLTIAVLEVARQLAVLNQREAAPARNKGKK